MSDLLGCSACYEIAIPACVETLTVEAGLTPATEYAWCVTDKFGNRYKGLSTTNGSGHFDISTADLPTGLFTPYSGAFTLQVFRQMAYCEPEMLTLCGDDFYCVQMTFEDVTTTEDITTYTIPCNC